MDSQTAATGVVLVDAELAGFAQRSLAKFQGLESRFTGAKGGGRPSRTAGKPMCDADLPWQRFYEVLLSACCMLLPCGLHRESACM